MSSGMKKAKATVQKSRNSECQVDLKSADGKSIVTIRLQKTMDSKTGTKKINKTTMTMTAMKMDPTGNPPSSTSVELDPETAEDAFKFLWDELKGNNDQKNYEDDDEDDCQY
jgi:hypothetical protein